MLVWPARFLVFVLWTDFEARKLALVCNWGLLQLNFELNRAAVRGAIAQVDLARMRLDEPPQPGRTSQFGATTARDLVNALNDLLDASNRFVEVWIGSEALRMRYAFDLGEMNLRENGIWNGLQSTTDLK